MRVIKFIMFPLFAGLITGCGIHPQKNYAQKAQVTNALSMPANIALRGKENFYPLPREPNLQAKTPSLIPPGSNLQIYNKSKKKKEGNNEPKHITRARWSEDHSGEPILVVMGDSTFAWSQVGKALHSSTYQILDQDPSMASYYILDTKITDNQITENTPIYRVFVKNDKNGTSKVVLMDESNEMVDSKIAKRVLAELEQHLA